jgi:hypothetical protein
MFLQPFGLPRSHVISDLPTKSSHTSKTDYTCRIYLVLKHNFLSERPLQVENLPFLVATISTRLSVSQAIHPGKVLEGGGHGQIEAFYIWMVFWLRFEPRTSRNISLSVTATPTYFLLNNLLSLGSFLVQY